MTFQEFYDSITNTEHPLQKQTKSLEEFWCSLYPLVEAKRGDKINLEDFHQLLINAITQMPSAIKEGWLSIDEPIDPEDLDEEIREAELDEEETAVKEFNYFLYTLAFQIAELHKMKDKQLNDAYKHYGIDSETGHRWYNFDLVDILSCGLRGFMNNGAEGDIENWADLGVLIEMGRIYE